MTFEHEVKAVKHWIIYLLQLLDCFTVDPPSAVPPGAHYGVGQSMNCRWCANLLEIWQPFIQISKYGDWHWNFLYFVHNKGQMYFPKQDGSFGSFYFYKDVATKNPRKYFQTYRLERTHHKTLTTENQRCHEGTTRVDTTICITRYLEETVGCSMGLYGTDPGLSRYQ